MVGIFSVTFCLTPPSALHRGAGETRAFLNFRVITLLYVSGVPNIALIGIYFIHVKCTLSLLPIPSRRVTEDLMGHGYSQVLMRTWLYQDLRKVEGGFPDLCLAQNLIQPGTHQYL